MNYARLRNALGLGIDWGIYSDWLMLAVGGLSVFASE